MQQRLQTCPWAATTVQSIRDRMQRFLEHGVVRPVADPSTGWSHELRLPILRIIPAMGYQLPP